jgi:hypothetical protein
MKASDLSQAKHDANNLSIALTKVAQFFHAFGLTIPREYLEAMERLQNFHAELLESTVSVNVEDEEKP